MRAVTISAMFLCFGLLSSCRTPEAADDVRHLDLPQLRVELPEGWRRVPPASPMRTAQVEVPPGEAAQAPLEMAVFHFGEGKGGSVADNVRRWIDEIEFAPGTSVHREEFGAHGYTVYLVDFEGTRRAGIKDGGAIERIPNQRILGGIVEGPGGPWYFKLTGPSAGVGARRDAFTQMLESVRPR